GLLPSVSHIFRNMRQQCFRHPFARFIIISFNAGIARVALAHLDCLPKLTCRVGKGNPRTSAKKSTPKLSTPRFIISQVDEVRCTCVECHCLALSILATLEECKGEKIASLDKERCELMAARNAAWPQQRAAVDAKIRVVADKIAHHLTPRDSDWP